MWRPGVCGRCARHPSRHALSYVCAFDALVPIMRSDPRRQASQPGYPIPTRNRPRLHLKKPTHLLLTAPHQETKKGVLGYLHNNCPARRPIKSNKLILGKKRARESFWGNKRTQNKKRRDFCPVLRCLHTHTARTHKKYDKKDKRREAGLTNGTEGNKTSPPFGGLSRAYLGEQSIAKRQSNATVVNPSQTHHARPPACSHTRRAPSSPYRIGAGWLLACGWCCCLDGRSP